MQIAPTTFVLELINFAVLVWILNHFLYRPVQAIMARRRAQIEQAVKDAAALRDEAEKLKEQYEHCFKDWETEQNAARAGLTKELAAARAAGLDEVRIAMEKQKQRLEASSAKKQADARRQMEKRALAQGAVFAAKFLERLQGPELDAKLTEVFIGDFEHWSKEKAEALTEAMQENGGKIVVTSAHALPDSARDLLEKTLSAKLDGARSVEFSVDAALIAGLCVTIGPWVLQADLQDELRFFTGEFGPDA